MSLPFGSRNPQCIRTYTTVTRKGLPPRSQWSNGSRAHLDKMTSWFDGLNVAQEEGPAFMIPVVNTDNQANPFDERRFIFWKPKPMSQNAISKNLATADEKRFVFWKSNTEEQNASSLNSPGKEHHGSGPYEQNRFTFREPKINTNGFNLRHSQEGSIQDEQHTFSPPNFNMNDPTHPIGAVPSMSSNRGFSSFNSRSPPPPGEVVETSQEGYELTSPSTIPAITRFQQLLITVRHAGS